MKVSQKVMLVIAGLLYLALAVAVAGVALSEGFRQSVVSIVDSIHYRFVFSSLVAALLFALAFIYTVRGAVVQEADDRTITTITELGQISISLRAIESAVKRAVRDIRGVREYFTRIDGDLDGVTIAVDIAVATNVNMPMISHQVQSALEAHVRDVVGVPVKQVQVNVRDTIGETRSRVE